MDKMEILKKDTRIETSVKVKKTISTLAVWLAVFNMFLFVPLSFFGVVPDTLVFVNSIIVLCLGISVAVLTEVTRRMIRENMIEMMNAIKDRILTPEDKEKLEEEKNKLFEKIEKITDLIINEDNCEEEKKDE